MAVATQDQTSIEELQKISWQLSRTIVEITTKAGSGHPSSSLSAIDILVALYFGGIMNYDAQEPAWPDRDRFILSKGHAAPGLYAVLAEAGYFDYNMLWTLREVNSPVEGHPNMRRLPGVEASTGSLGQGLSIGLGHALAARVDKRSYRVYVMIGDGEADQGQIWEAAMAAAKYKVSNLTCILDYNKFQQTGPVKEVMPALEPVGKKWEAFGWEVHTIDGHDFKAILQTFDRVQKAKNKPQAIIANTLKGKGLSIFEKSANRMHGEPVPADKLDAVLQEMDEAYGALEEEE